MTPLKRVYSAFLSKILEDEWQQWTMEEIEADMAEILDAAIVRFKFPRVCLKHDEKKFFDDLDIIEIQIIATYMKCEWLNRNIMTWENVKPLYEERDFSQANLLDKLNATLEAERYNALQLESIYYRSVKGRPFRYRRLAGRPVPYLDPPPKPDYYPHHRPHPDSKPHPHPHHGKKEHERFDC